MKRHMPRSDQGLPRDARGLTLIETVLALGVLSIGLLGMLAALMGSLASAGFTEARTVALQDAQGVLESLTLLPEAGGPGAPVGCLLDVATNINAGILNPAAPWGTIAVPAGAQANLLNETVRVDVFTPPNIGNPLGVVPVVPAALPTANYDEYEILVTVTWLQGQRQTSVTARTVRNILP